MPYLVLSTLQPRYTCQQAKQACRPTFVFSISGQVNFRQALHHLKNCYSPSCQQLRRLVIQGFNNKVRWLLEQESYVGCSSVQQVLYTSKKTKLTHAVFEDVATHLSRCPKEPCAQLRRAVLLTVRAVVGQDSKAESRDRF